MSLKTRIIISACVIVLSIACAVQTNAVSTKGYSIRQLEQQLSVDQADIQKLTTQVAGYQALASITERVKQSVFVPVTGIAYIKAAGGIAVANR